MLRQVVFYDGVCATCHRLVRFLLARRAGREGRFLFVPIQALIEQDAGHIVDIRGRAVRGDSIVIRKGKNAYQRADAIFALLSALGFPWTLLSAFRIVPLFILNYFYDLIARHRFQLFGQADPQTVCEGLGVEQRKFFSSFVPKDQAE
jgi:predicted DCC family thiol-disulfide oxidoreductase YuxK